MLINQKELIDIVITVAKQEMLPLFANVKCGEKADGSVITEVDYKVQHCIASRLQDKYPGIDLLGEEMEASEQTALLASGKPVWCLDPLDGTRNFSAGIPYFSVSLALIENDEVSIGIVYDPARDECFVASKGQGATLNNKPLCAKETGLSLSQTMAIIDFKRLSPDLASRLVTAMPYSSQRSFGSIALDWCWIAAGRAHIYLHGKQNIWDYAAGCLILNEAGGHSITLSGENVFINSLQQRSTVAALDKKLFDQWLCWLGVNNVHNQAGS